MNEPKRATAGIMNDQREMERLRQGDIAALGTLVDRYQTRALRAAYLVTHDLALSEDVVSGAFLRVFERADQYDPNRPFGPWFYRIVVNDAIKAVQRRDRTTTLDRTETIRRQDDSTDPEAAAALNEDRRAVRNALAQLTPSQRGAVVMRYFLDLSESEMVERTGRTRGTVKRHLHDARARLKRLLQTTVCATTDEDVEKSDMNTQPMDEYLNRERLTDLAQFAVPDGHDLWPKIERAARASSSSLATPRTGILSLGLSRAWTAVGILLIAATFAALGFGLAVLVLLNGHDQVPATQPEATLLPTPIAPKASPTPSVSKGPATSQVSTIPSREAAHAKLDSILSGETLDRYRALPPAYQEALGLYTWHNIPHDRVRSAVKDKIDQWGDWVIPLPGLLGEERAKRFEELDGEIYNHAYLLLSYYVLVLNTEPPDMSRGAAMRQFVDYIAPLPPNTSTTEPEETRFSGWVTAPKVKWPALEIVLTRTALARLDALGPRIRERIADGISSTGEDDIKNVAAFLTHYELFLLKAQPGLELQLLEDTLTGDDLATFRGLSEADRDRVELFFQRGLFNLHYLSTASLPYYQTIPDPTPDTLAEQAASAMEWVTLTRKEELTNTYADSWVSENGFIQFTTGDDPLDDPLPGTNPWCIHPSSAPKEPAGPLLVPSKLPEGYGADRSGPDIHAYHASQVPE